jgi:hypothetical protein
MFSKISFSQEGEYLILNRFFDENDEFLLILERINQEELLIYINFSKKNGRDNTDSMPVIMNVFSIERPKDISLEICISNTEGTLEYNFLTKQYLTHLIKMNQI